MSALLALSTCGCAPALSTFHPAHIAEKGHAQAEFGADAALALSRPREHVFWGIDAAYAARSSELSQEERLQLFKAAGGHALSPTAVTPHVGIGFTPVDRWEANLRYTSSSFRVGTRHQLSEMDKDGYDFTVGAGLAYFLRGYPLESGLEILELKDFWRWQIDVPILFGRRGEWFRLWGGPRLMLARFGTDIVLNLPAFNGYPGEQENGSFLGYAAYLGTQIGGAVGYKNLFVGFELTSAYIFGSGLIDAFGQRGFKFNLDGYIINPAIGVIAEF
ncbi:hypothetical protein [Sorangium sp. So ce131]|uniref:hypothetical protein n=1 Tax=Sorangium sp. So ce131 TaxID=3133282 RepID=UPI003F645CDB